MASWPETLPKFSMHDFREALPDVVERIEMAAGPPYTRGKSTAGPTPLSGSIFMTEAQWQTLKTFFMTTLRGGLLSMDMPHPVDGTAQKWQFVAPPSRTKTSHDRYRVEISLEMKQ